MTAHLSIHSFSHGAAQARQIAQDLQVAYKFIEVAPFPDGESLVTTEQPSETTAIYCPLDRPNERLIDLCLAVEALRRNGAKRMILIAPYLCYMRQDAAFHAGEAISQHAIGQWLSTLFDRIITVDTHLHRTLSLTKVFPGIEADNLNSAPAIAAFVRSQGMPQSTLLVGPDSESKQWLEQMARELKLEILVGRKQRHDRQVKIEFPELQLDARPVLFVDDIVSSGGTLIETVRRLKVMGAGEIHVAVTHALCTGETIDAIEKAGACKIWSTSSVPHFTNAIPLTSLYVPALQREIHEQGSRQCG